MKAWTVGLIGALAVPALAQEGKPPAPPAPGAPAKPGAPAEDEVAARVRDLGSPDFETREKAEARLVELGEKAAKALEEAAKDEDPEVARRAERALRKIRRAPRRADPTEEAMEPGEGAAPRGDRDPEGDPWRDLFGGDPRDLDAIRKRLEETRRRMEEAFGGDWDPLRDVEKRLRRVLEEDLGGGGGDLGKRLQEQLRRLLGERRGEGWDEAWPDAPRQPQGPGLRFEFGGPGIKSQTTVVQGDRKVTVTRDGEKLKVEVTEPGEDGKPATKVYEAENEAEFREKHPEAARYVEPGFGGFQFRFGRGPLAPRAGERPLRPAVRAPRAAPTSDLGLVAEPASEALRYHLGLPEGRGLFVRGVAEGSWAARAGIERFDLVLSAAGKPIGRLSDLNEVVRAAEADIPLEIHRRGKALKLAAGK